MLEKEIMIDLQALHFFLLLNFFFSSLSLYVSSLPSSFSWASVSFGHSSATNSAFILTTLIVWNIVSICWRKNGCTWLHMYKCTLVNRWLLKINKKNKKTSSTLPEKSVYVEIWMSAKQKNLNYKENKLQVEAPKCFKPCKI